MSNMNIKQLLVLSVLTYSREELFVVRSSVTPMRRDIINKLIRERICSPHRLQRIQVVSSFGVYARGGPSVSGTHDHEAGACTDNIIVLPIERPPAAPRASGDGARPCCFRAQSINKKIRPSFGKPFRQRTLTCYWRLRHGMKRPSRSHCVKLFNMIIHPSMHQLLPSSTTQANTSSTTQDWH